LILFTKDKKLTDDNSPFSDMTGGDVRLLMPVFSRIWQLSLDTSFLNDNAINYLNSLTLYKDNNNITFLKSLGLYNFTNYNLNGKIDGLKLCAKLLQNMYYAFLQSYSTTITEENLQMLVYNWRKLTFIILQDKMKVPKNHCLREMVEEWKLFGPAVWGETSFKESKHAFFRTAINISNNKDAEYFCTKLEYSYQLAVKILDGGIFTNGKSYAQNQEMNNLIDLFKEVNENWITGATNTLDTHTFDRNWLIKKNIPHGLSFTVKGKVRKDHWPFNLNKLINGHILNTVDIALPTLLEMRVGSFRKYEDSILDIGLEVGNVAYSNSQYFEIIGIYVTEGTNTPLLHGRFVIEISSPYKLFTSGTIVSTNASYEQILLDPRKVEEVYIMQHACGEDCTLNEHTVDYEMCLINRKYHK